MSSYSNEVINAIHSNQQALATINTVGETYSYQFDSTKGAKVNTGDLLIGLKQALEDMFGLNKDNVLEYFSIRVVQILTQMKDITWGEGQIQEIRGSGEVTTTNHTKKLEEGGTTLVEITRTRL